MALTTWLEALGARLRKLFDAIFRKRTVQGVGATTGGGSQPWPDTGPP
jgi:hypothetical protein